MLKIFMLKGKKKKKPQGIYQTVYSVILGSGIVGVFLSFIFLFCIF